MISEVANMKKPERLQAINNELNTNKQLILKYLQILFCLYAANLGLSLIKYLPIPYDLTAWANRVLLVGTIICLFYLGGINRHYRIAGIMRAVILIRSVVFALLPAPVLFSLYETPASSMALSIFFGIITVVSWLATYFEYSAHGELSAVGLPRLTRQWLILFAFSLLVAVLGSIASYVVAYMGGYAIVGNNVNYVISAISRVIDVLYLWLLYKLVVFIRNK